MLTSVKVEWLLCFLPAEEHGVGMGKRLEYKRGKLGMQEKLWYNTYEECKLTEFKAGRNTRGERKEGFARDNEGRSL